MPPVNDLIYHPGMDINKLMNRKPRNLEEVVNRQLRDASFNDLMVQLNRADARRKADSELKRFTVPEEIAEYLRASGLWSKFERASKDDWLKLLEFIALIEGSTLENILRGYIRDEKITKAREFLIEEQDQRLTDFKTYE